MAKKILLLALVVFGLGGVSLGAVLMQDRLGVPDALETGSVKSALSFYVVDLDGNGIELIPLTESNVYFDVDGDGLAERTEWVSPEDGFVMANSIREREFTSYADRIYYFFTNHKEKLEEFDKDSNYIYDEYDFLPFGRDNTYQDLRFKITRDKKLNGIPKTGHKDKVECPLIRADYSQLEDKKTFLLICKDRTYTVHEINFSYEDTNTRWDSVCKQTARNDRGSERAGAFLKKNCRKGTIKQGE